MTAPAIALDGVAKRFGGTAVITDATLAVHAGERHALIGPNGAGKSTLFNLVSGLLRPSAGSILLHGRAIHRLPPERIADAGLARSFQITSIFARMSVFENLRIGVLARHARYTLWRSADSLKGVTREVEALLAAVRLEHRRDQPAATLPYSEQRALEIGLTLTRQPSVILLDEPTAGMSREEAQHTVALIRTVTRGRTLLVIEHDMDVVFGLCDRISVLAHGRVIASGAPQVVAADDAVREAYLGTPAARGAA